MKEYIVTLHNKEDLDDFYNDMETPGGDLYIPDRAVDLELRRPISRNTNYMLTDEEAEELKNDSRVWDVEAKDVVEAVIGKYEGYTINGNFDRDNFIPSSGDLNWGLWRHVNETNSLSGEWGSDGTRTAAGTFNLTASGKNVDVLIVDSVINTTVMNHPELAVNADGTGGTRVQHFNWFSLTSALGFGSNGTYDYSDDGEEHGVHVAGTVAGNTQGWARDANIYNIQSFGQNHGGGGLSTSTYWDYIRQWHNTKPINPETGRRNPTVSNHSYSFSTGKNGGNYVGGYSGVGAFSYRGAIYDKYGDQGSDLTDAELEARGVVVEADGDFTISSWSTSSQADSDDAAADGIIFCVSSGNSSMKNTKSGTDYNNVIYYRLGSNQYASAQYSNRTVSRSGASHSNQIVVGALGINKDDRKSSFSNCGNAVNIHAAGYGIVSCIPGSSGNYQDSRNSSFYMEKKSGTSMASPQVCGVLALLAESNPGLTQAEAKAWLEANATTDEMFDSGADSTMDFTSLQGSPNRILLWKNQRPETGAAFPKINAKARPTSGAAYPRPRIRKRG